MPRQKQPKKILSKELIQRGQLASYEGLVSRVCDSLRLEGGVGITTAEERMQAVRNWLEKRSEGEEMSNDTAIATRQTTQLAEQMDLDKMLEFGQHLVDSGLLPEAVDTPQKAMVIILTGRELGLPEMQSLRSINVIKGKPTMSAEGMLALAYKNIKGFAFEVVDSSEELCKVQAKRDGTEWHEESFTWDDAVRMQLDDKYNWRKMPKFMLRWRATSACLRIVCPDAIAKIYTPEEIDPEQRQIAPVDVTDEVEVIEPKTVPEDEPPADSRTGESAIDDLTDPRIVGGEDEDGSEAEVVEDVPEEVVQAQPETASEDGPKTTDSQLITEEKRNSIMAAFKKYNIELDVLEKIQGLACDWTLADKDELLSLYNDVTSGKVKAADVRAQAEG